MDTTFKNPKSLHNIHTVKCIDCHTKGVPRKRTAQDSVPAESHRKQLSIPSSPSVKQSTLTRLYSLAPTELY
jgi:hypothetical protein